MALRQILNNFYVGLDAELPANLPSGSRFMAEDTKFVYGYGDDELPFFLGGGGIVPDKIAYTDVDNNFETDQTVQGNVTADAYFGDGEELLNVTTWKNLWAITSYKKDDIVRDGIWTMVANKDTSEKAAPEEIARGYFIETDKVWTDQNTLNNIITGTKIIISPNFAVSIDRYRVYLPESSNDVQYTMALIDNTGGGEVVIDDFDIPLGFGPDTWFTRSIRSTLFPASSEIQILLRATKIDSVYTDQVRYNYFNDDRVPGTGEISVNRTKQGTGEQFDTYIRIDQTDLDTNNINGALLIPGSTVLMEATVNTNNYHRWLITGAGVQTGNYYDYPAELTSANGALVDGEEVLTTIELANGLSVDYVEDVDGWIGIVYLGGSFQGLIGPTLGGLVTNNNQYGADVSGTRFTMPQDWDIMATSGTSGDSITTESPLQGLQSVVDTGNETITPIEANYTPSQGNHLVNRDFLDGYTITEDKEDFIQNRANLIIGNASSFITSINDLINLFFNASAGQVTEFDIIGTDVYATVNGNNWQPKSGESSFKGKPITRFIDKRGILSITIGNSSFEACSQLREVYIPKGTSVTNGTFRNCTGLNVSDLYIPSVNLITQNNCFNTLRGSRLDELNLPNIVSINDGSNTFANGIYILNLPKLVSINSSDTVFSFFKGTLKAPNLASLGTDPSIDYGHFNSVDANTVLHVNYVLKTKNNGLPDATLQNAINLGATVFYEGQQENLIAPSNLEMYPNYGLPSTTQDVVFNFAGINQDSRITDMGPEITINSQSLEVNNFGTMQIRANITHNSTEGSYDVTVWNGYETVFAGAYETVNGTVYKPASNEWYDLINNPNISEYGNLRINTASTTSKASWRTIPANTDFRIGGTYQFSEFSPNSGSSNADADRVSIELYNSSNVRQFWLDFKVTDSNGFQRFRSKNVLGGDSGDEGTVVVGIPAYLERVNSVWRLYVNKELKHTFAETINEELFVKVEVRDGDLTNILYTDLSTAGTPEQYNDNYLTDVDLTGTIIPNRVYIDVVNGDDGTAQLGIFDKPFKTISGAYNALPADDGNYWTFWFLDNSTRVIDFNVQRKVRFFTLNEGIFDFSSIVGEVTWESFYFDCPNSLIYHSGINLTLSTVQPVYVNCRTLQIETPTASVAGPAIFSNSSGNNKIIARTVILRNIQNTSGLLRSGYLNCSILDQSNTSIARYEIKLRCEELKLNGQSCSLYTNAGYFEGFPFKRISGSGTLKMTDKEIDVSKIDTDAGITIEAIAGLTGKVHGQFQGEILLPASNINVHNFEGRVKPSSFINSCPINLSIRNSKISCANQIAPFRKIDSNSTTFNMTIENSEIIQDTPGNLLKVERIDSNTEYIKMLGNVRTNALSTGSTQLLIVKNTDLPDWNDSPKTITSSFTIGKEHNIKKPIWLNPTAPITITVDDTLPDNFECEFLNISTHNVTFVAGTGNLNTPNGNILEQNGVATLLKRLNNNDYWLLGNLITP